MHKFKVGQLVVTTAVFGSCGCGTIAKNTIIQVNSGKSQHQSNERTDAQIYPNQGYNTAVFVENVRPLNPGYETINAKRLFEKANSYKHATFN